MAATLLAEAMPLDAEILDKERRHARRQEAPECGSETNVLKTEIQEREEDETASAHTNAMSKEIGSCHIVEPEYLLSLSATSASGRIVALSGVEDAGNAADVARLSLLSDTSRSPR